MAKGIKAPCATPRPNPAGASLAKLARTTRGMTKPNTNAITARGSSFASQRRASGWYDDPLLGVVGMLKLAACF